ncbi:hypothetical protein ACN6AT_37780 (plasmid) [Streptomyces sp. JL4002]|uniref:hypothetical protein n=1 Tax=Streptomyces sp. JL4002 TaxID=3404781 RepID=UPI003B28AC9C
MSAPTQPPVAKKRPIRTRTTRVSARPALAISTLKPHHVDLRPDFVSLVCPDCERWAAVTGAQGSAPKLVPHHAARAGAPGQHRCPGANRLVLLDLTIAQWTERTTEANTDAGARRTTKVLLKPKMQPAPPVSRMVPAQLNAASARQVYTAHRNRCSACTGRAHCTDGERLGAIVVWLTRQEPRRRQVEELLEKRAAEAERRRIRQLPRKRAAEWAAVVPQVRRTDTQREQRPAGDAPTDGPSVQVQRVRSPR